MGEVEEIKDRYKVDNLPISDKTREGANIDTLGAVGRMLSVQDGYIEDCLKKLTIDLAQVQKEQNDLIFKFIEEQTKLNLKIDARLDGLDKTVKRYKTTLDRHERKINALETQIDELKDLIKNR